MEATDRAAAIETVVKFGGGVLARLEHFEAALAAVERAARSQRLLVVPGGGPFADVVRHVDRTMKLCAEATHWMAVLAMDQYAHLLVSRLTEGVLVERPGDIPPAAADRIVRRRIPVLAPSRWLREADPLPHSWSVTSDSIAAWVAGRVGAQRLVLIKPPGAGRAAPERLVDSYFRHTLPPDVTPYVVAADDPERLDAALSGVPDGNATAWG
jgi:aspartokinase-like uncharacterized kinase